MAVPNIRTPELALDVEGNHTTTNHYLTTGGNQTGSVPTQHGSDGEEVNLDYYLPLYCAASSGNWEEASKFLDNDPHAAKARISNLSMTALHVAASEGHSEFVEKLVKRVPRDVLGMQDEMGFTPLHYAAIGGSLRSAKALLMENLKLAQCVDAEGRTPLLLAATLASENKELVWYFLLVTTNEEPGHPFTGHWAANLVNMLIASGFHEISLYVLNKYPELAIAKDKEDCTALYVLARNQSNFLSGSRLGFWESCIYSFLPVEVDSVPPHSVRTYVARHGSVQNLQTMATPEQYGVLHGLRRVLFGAIKRIAPASFTQLHDAKLRHHCAVELIATVNGIVEIISMLVESFPDLIWVRLLNNQYLLLNFAIELRHEHLFRTVYDKTARSKLMAATLLESGGSILHLAAKLAPLPQLSSISGAALQMQRELQWFKEVEKLVHPYYKESRNQNGESARELFTKEHKLLAESGEKWLKDTSNSCMLVSTLVATVVFVAAFTVPGVPNIRTPELALDVEGNHTTTNHYLTTGGNQTGSVPTQHGSDGEEEVNLDYYLPLYCAASSGNWEEASKFLDNDPHAAKARISNLSMTALHVAASEGHSEFVEKLVKRVPRDVLGMQDEMGFTPLHYAAIGGSLRSAKALLMENLKLAQCVDAEGRTPLLLAATLASENKELVWYFLLVTTNEEPGHPFTGHWAANLVNMLIASGFHEISLYVLNKYPELAIAKDKEDCTALYVLARNQSNFLSGSRLGFWESCIYSFLPVEVDSVPPHSVRTYVARHGSVQNLQTMATPEQYGVLHGLRRVLFGAIKRIAPASFTQLHDAKLRHHCAVELIATVNGIVEIISMLVESFPDLIWVRLLNNQYLLLNFAIELRHEHLFRTVYDKTARSKLMAATLLESGGSILHLAAKLAPLPQLSSTSGAALQMQRELQWFKEVEKLVHPYYKESRNQNGESARELFTKEHKLLAESGEKWLKDTSNSCMLVSTLVATVVFVAAFTVPGGNDNEGAPIFLQKKSVIFLVFVVSDTVALFSSLTSLLMFLSILTARYAEEDFLESLPKRLIIGLGTLFFAIAATMVAFGATLSIVLSKRFNRVSVPITLLASFPVTLFALLQLPLFIQMVRSTFGQSILRPKKLG
ncbi:hypothetical protein C1H46_029043 [Malus baccata]|uniref:PGG domain-containing protein n=1 Tax=Malus baccata TaxID=106549 RepID=A0A540LG13_MALBA|nr:hypothetical protein C1H46_029043 [Malus baccata]